MFSIAYSLYVCKRFKMAKFLNLDKFNEEKTHRLSNHFDFRLSSFFQTFLRDRHAALFFGLGNLEHHVEHRVLDDALEASRARLSLDRLLGDGAEGVFFEDQLDIVHREQLFILLDGRILRLGQNAQEVVLGERFKRADDGQTSDDLRNNAVLHEVFGAHLVNQLVEAFRRILLLALDFRAEADARCVLLKTLGYDVLDADEGAADDEEDILRINLDRRRFGVLPLAARRELDDGAFEHLEQRLLHALVPGIGGDRVVRARLSRDLVELVEIDDAVLRLLDVLFRRIVEVANGDLDIRADEARFCEARRVRHGKWNVEEARQVRQKCRLAAARRAEHDDVRLLDVRAVLVHVAVLHAFIMVVDGYGENLLRTVLIDDVLVEVRLDDMRLVLLQNLVELASKIELLLLDARRLVLLDEIVYVLDAVLADGKSRVRVKDRHIILIVHRDLALAEAAGMLDRFLSRHYDSPFVRVKGNADRFSAS